MVKTVALIIIALSLVHLGGDILVGDLSRPRIVQTCFAYLAPVHISGFVENGMLKINVSRS